MCYTGGKPGGSELWLVGSVEKRRNEGSEVGSRRAHCSPPLPLHLPCRRKNKYPEVVFLLASYSSPIRVLLESYCRPTPILLRKTQGKQVNHDFVKNEKEFGPEWPDTPPPRHRTCDDCQMPAESRDSNGRFPVLAILAAQGAAVADAQALPNLPGEQNLGSRNARRTIEERMATANSRSGGGQRNESAVLVRGYSP